MITADISLRPLELADREFVRQQLMQVWGTTTIYSCDVPYQADELSGWIAWLDGERAGHLTIAYESDRCEIISLVASVENHGVGSRLLEAARRAAIDRGYSRITLTTSNDNFRALGLYQRRGYRLVRIFPGLIDRYRQRQPDIPRIGSYGVPIHDEIELALELPGST